MGETPFLFNVLTPLGFAVRVTQSYWDLITTVKHPVMKGRESDVMKTLENPEEIRRSVKDVNVHLFYKTMRSGRWVCAVTKKLETDGFLITAYPTDSMKEGVKIWPR